jgi:putative addiction module component (TIGR02574 family)
MRTASNNVGVKLVAVGRKFRIRLVEDLWDSIASDQRALVLTAEQKAELDQRLDAYELDRNCGQLATDVITSIRRRL